MKKHPLYRIWIGIKERCYNKNRKDYPLYGGRGIVVCDRWKNDFNAFVEDMGERPAGTSIDRYPNKDGNYEPGNCRWATPSEQMKNRRSYDSCQTKVTQSQKQDIKQRRMNGERNGKLAKEYGVSTSLITRITRPH